MNGVVGAPALLPKTAPETDEQRVLFLSKNPRDPSTFSDGTWTLQTYITVPPITVPEKVRLDP